MSEPVLAFVSAEAFEEHLALRSKVSLFALREWLHQNDLVVVRCECGMATCCGFRVAGPETLTDRWQPQMDRAEFEEFYASNHGLSVSELRAKLRRLGQGIYPCACEDARCRGWQVCKPTERFVP